MAGAACSSESAGPGWTRVLWHVPGLGWAMPAFDSLRAYFPAEYHEVLAIDKQTGEVAWQVRIPYVATCSFFDTSRTAGFDATMAGSTVVVVDDGLFGFDAATGQHRWTWRPPVGCMAPVSRPESDDQTVYAGASRGSIYALDAATGATRWRGQFLPESAAIAYSPVLDNGTIYSEFNIQVATFPFDSGGVVALDAATGATKWIYYFPRTLQTSPPRGRRRIALTPDLVVAPSDDGLVYVLDRVTGGVAWEVPRIDNRLIGDERKVAASGGFVFVGSNSGLVIAYDADSGTERWRVSTGGGVGRLLADGDAVYASISAALVVLDAGTGQLRWRVGAGIGSSTSILSPPAVDIDRVYAGGTDGFYAFRK